MVEALTIYFRGRISPAEDGWWIQIIQEGPNHKPIAMLDQGVWPLVREAAQAMADYLAREQRDLWRLATNLATKELNGEEL